jgi:prefoldin subunit 5
LDNEEIIQKLSTLKAQVNYLQERDKQLNGTIQRVDTKVDGLKTWIMGVMAGVIASIFVSLVNLGR